MLTSVTEPSTNITRLPGNRMIIYDVYSESSPLSSISSENESARLGPGYVGSGHHVLLTWIPTIYHEDTNSVIMMALKLAYTSRRGREDSHCCI